MGEKIPIASVKSQPHIPNVKKAFFALICTESAG
jgi:hypothetical protein